MDVRWEDHSFSVIFFYIYMTKTERKVVKPTKAQLYTRFLNDIISKRYKDQSDNLFALNSNHPKVKYTIEVDPDKYKYNPRKWYCDD